MAKKRKGENAADEEWVAPRVFLRPEEGMTDEEFRDEFISTMMAMVAESREGPTRAADADADGESAGDAAK